MVSGMNQISEKSSLYVVSVFLSRTPHLVDEQTPLYIVEADIPNIVNVRCLEYLLLLLYPKELVRVLMATRSSHQGLYLFGANVSAIVHNTGPVICDDDV